MEVKYIHKLPQEILDLKYITVLNKRKFNKKEHKSQQRVWADIYINY